MQSHVPGLEKITPVYAVIVLMIYSWTTLWYFWKMPGWLYFMTVWELITAFSFAILVNLLESLLVLAAILMAALVLPQKWFRQAFVARGSALAAMGLGWLMVIANGFQIKDEIPWDLVRWTPAMVAAMVVLAILAGIVPTVRKLIESLANRLTVFLFISLPLSLLALLIAAIALLL